MHDGNCAVLYTVCADAKLVLDCEQVLLATVVVYNSSNRKATPGR
jgi:hypothetical protein